MRLRLPSAILLLTGFGLGPTRAYQIDPSCDPNAAATKLLRTAIPGAVGLLRMADNVLNGFGTPGENANAKKLATLIWGSDSEIEKAKDFYLALTSSPNIVQEDPLPANGGTYLSNIVFYCSLDRFKQIGVDAQGKPQYEDTTNNIKLRSDVIGKCASTTKAFCYNSEKNRVGFITMCPQYMQTYVGSGLSASLDFTLAVQQMANQPTVIDIDLTALMDAIVLHELFHTLDASLFGNKAGAAIDVKDASGKAICYKWKNIVALGKASQGSNNADSLAYFAIGTKAILDNAWTINEDGTYSKPGASAKRYALGDFFDSVFGEH